MSSPRRSERYELSDANARAVVVAGFVLALILVGSLAVSAWISQGMADALQDEERPNPLRDLRKAPVGPVLQSVPARELVQQRAWEDEMLNGTAWVDPLNQIVRIPIERAFELSLQEGFPVRTPDDSGENTEEKQ